MRLLPEEMEIVMRGALADPGYTPFPAGRRSRYEREEEERADREGREPEPYPDTTATDFERLLSAEHWSRYSLQLALLVGDGPRLGSSSKVFAMARAEGSHRGRVSGTRVVRIGPWKPLHEPVDLEALIEAVAPARRRYLRELLRGMARPLPPATGAALSAALRSLVPALDDVTRGLTDPTPPRRRVHERFERRDANATALSFLTPRWRALRPVAGVAPPALAEALERGIAERSENDFITDDSAVFPGWEAGARPTGGWWTFQHGDQLMWIKNINVSSAEAATGADLVYVRAEPRAIVLVQYKLISRTAQGAAIVRPDSRFRSQLDRLISLKSDAPPPGVRSDYRLAEEFAFFKFVDPQGKRGTGEDELTPGRYLPARYVQQWLASQPAGPRGGTRLDLDDERSLDPSVFAGLVRGCWVGSRGDITQLLEMVTRAPSADLTLAVSQQA